MTTDSTASTASEFDRASSDRAWFIAGRWEEYAGEERANLLRTIGIGAFYLVELANYYGLDLGWLSIAKSVDEKFHLRVTLLAVAWAMVALGAQLCLRRQIFPAALKYATTAMDLAILTMILGLADGARSPLVVAYFLIIALAGLRFDLWLVRCAACGAAAGYLLLLGYARWFAPAQRQADLLVPRYHQLIFLIALLLAGVVVGQTVRRARRLAEDYARRVVAAREDRP